MLYRLFKQMKTKKWPRAYMNFWIKIFKTGKRKMIYSEHEKLFKAKV